MKAKLLLGTVLSSVAAMAATIYTVDFIPDPNRTNFNGFEGVNCSSPCPNTYSEGGVLVEQINSNGPDSIWNTYLPVGFEGSFAWYPNGGDPGYTRITRVGGLDFTNVGFLRGSGWGDDPNLRLYFELYNNGSLLQSGDFAHTTDAQYIGFGFGGFDEIRVWDSIGISENALAIDSIELADEVVPEPATFVIAGLGLVAFVIGKRR